MRSGNWISACILAVALTALVMPATAQQSDSALVRAAKEKAADKKAEHVYTNDDFPESPGASDTSPGGKGAAVTEGTAQGDSAKANASAEKSDTKPDGKKVDASKPADSTKPAEDAKLKDLEAKLADAKKGEQELRRKLMTLQEKADNEKDEFRRNMYLDMISNQQVTLSDFRREQENLQSQVDKEKDKAKPAESKPSE